MKCVRLRRAAGIICVGIAVSVAGTALAAGGAGSLDRSFGRHGKVLTQLRHGTSHPRQASLPRVNAVVIDDHHRVVAAGSAARQFALARYLPNGHLDHSFSNNGKVETMVSKGHILRFGAADAAVIDSKGRIVAAGSTTVDNGDPRAALVRYKPNGRLDRSFGKNGIVRTGLAASARSVAIDAKGRIVIAGSGRGFELARFEPNGSVDQSFGTDGGVTTKFSDGSNAAHSVAIDSKGRIVVGGYTWPRNKGPELALARYESNGALDSSFGHGGKVVTNVGHKDEINSIAIDGQDGVVVAGDTGKAHSFQFMLARYLDNGSLDGSFGDGGTLTTDFGGRAFGNAVALDSRGRIVVAGGTTSSGTRKFALAQYLPNGELNDGFSRDGKTITKFGGGKRPQGANAVAIDSKQRIVAAGYAGSKFALARYLGR